MWLYEIKKKKVIYNYDDVFNVQKIIFYKIIGKCFINYLVFL
jgi:hypothetical protein